MERPGGLKADALSTHQLAPSEPSARAQSAPGKPGGGRETQGRGELEETCRPGCALGAPGRQRSGRGGSCSGRKATLSNKVLLKVREVAGAGRGLPTVGLPTPDPTLPPGAQWLGKPHAKPETCWSWGRDVSASCPQHRRENPAPVRELRGWGWF